MIKTAAVPMAILSHTKYPYLGEYNNGVDTTIVLFNSKNTGMVVHADNNQKHTIGDYLTNWVESNFVPCSKVVTISNN